MTDHTPSGLPQPQSAEFEDWAVNQMYAVRTESGRLRWNSPAYEAIAKAAAPKAAPNGVEAWALAKEYCDHSTKDADGISTLMFNGNSDGFDQFVRELFAAASPSQPVAAEGVMGPITSAFWQKVGDVLEQSLGHYRCSTLQSEDEEPLPLVDALCSVEGTTIETASSEMELLCDHLLLDLHAAALSGSAESKKGG